MTIGEKIKYTRKEKNMTQATLAKVAGISEISIRKYESGERYPKLEAVRKIADALGVYIGDLNPDWGSFSEDELKKDWELEPTEQQLLKNYRSLNDAGQNKAHEQIELLTKIPEFQK